MSSTRQLEPGDSSLEPRRFRHLSYLDLGSTAAPALFLLHGGTMTALWNWESQLPSLTERYRVIAPDSPGHGLSANPRDRLRYEDMARDMLDLATELGLDRAVFYGFSDGAQIALEVGIRAPQLPVALVLSAVLHRFTPAYHAAMAELAGADPFAEPLWSTRQPELSRQCRSRHADWPALASQIWELWSTPPDLPADRLSRVAAPTLLLTGDRDPFAGLEQTIELLRLLPVAELAVIPAAGHDYDARFTRAALEFLDCHAADPR